MHIFYPRSYDSTLDPTLDSIHVLDTLSVDRVNRRICNPHGMVGITPATTRNKKYYYQLLIVSPSVLLLDFVFMLVDFR